MPYLDLGRVCPTLQAQQAINHLAPRKATIMECLALGVVPIINENDSTNTAELRFGDNVTWLSEMCVK